LGLGGPCHRCSPYQFLKSSQLSQLQYMKEQEMVK
jgi:hypothetical protein